MKKLCLIILIGCFFQYSLAQVKTKKVSREIIETLQKFEASETINVSSEKSDALKGTLRMSKNDKVQEQN